MTLSLLIKYKSKLFLTYSFSDNILYIFDVLFNILPFCVFNHEPILIVLYISLVFAQTPQVYKSYINIKIGKDSAVSVVAMSVSALSGIFWITYAVLINDALLVLCNAIVLANNIAIIALEIIGKRSRALKTA